MVLIALICATVISSLTTIQIIYDTNMNISRLTLFCIILHSALQISSGYSCETMHAMTTGQCMPGF